MSRRTLRLALVATVAALFMPTLLARAAVISVARVTFDSDRDAETSVAINPLNPQNVVAGWISQGDNTCGYGVSFDGGTTWPVVGVVPGIQRGSGGEHDRGTDPSVAFDTSGNAYYTCLAFNLFPPGTGSAGTIFVSKSTNGGVSWGAPVAALTGVTHGNSVRRFEDHQFLTSNPANGNLYLTETRFTAFGKSAILFTRSTDQGATWMPPVTINVPGQNATFQDSFSATGQNPSTIYVTFGAFSNAGLPNWDRIYIARSTNGGLTFSTPQLLQTITPLPDPLPNAPWRSDNNLWVAVDRTSNQIYVNYSDYDAGNADVRLMRLTDTGSSFTVQGITRVNGDATQSDQFFPFTTVAPNGRVDVCYQDRSYLPGNAAIFTTCSMSADHGLTFTHQQVTTTPFDASNNNFIGDYNWQVSKNAEVVPSFVGDATPGADQNGQEVFVARVTP